MSNEISSQKNIKKCPFREQECSPDCMLFISVDELNENVATRLKSIGVVSGEGCCALKNIALAEIRKMYETTSVKRF